MASTRQKKNSTKKTDNRQVLAAKNTQALGAARVQKKKSAAYNSRGRGQGLNDENIDVTRPSNRVLRSSRLGGNVNANTNAQSPPNTTNMRRANRTPAGRSAKPRGNFRAPSPTPTYEEAHTDAADTIQDLQRQLQQEKDKNRLLYRTATASNARKSTIIPRPKGGIGAAGFRLITEMKLDKDNKKDKALYNDILASVRALAIGAGIDLGRTYRDQSITKLSKLMVAAREAEPYLARFEDDWVTGQILRQYINGKRKYENAKANEKANSGDEQRRMAPIANQRIDGLHRPVEDEIGRMNFSGGSDSDMDGSNDFDKASSGYNDDDEWTGFDHHSHEEDELFGGSDHDEVGGSENDGMNG